MFPGDYHLSPPIVSLKVFEDLVLPVKGYGCCCVVGIGLGCLLHMHLYWGTCHTRQVPMGAFGKINVNLLYLSSNQSRIFPLFSGIAAKGSEEGFWGMDSRCGQLHTCSPCCALLQPELIDLTYCWFSCTSGSSGVD